MGIIDAARQGTPLWRVGLSLVVVGFGSWSLGMWPAQFGQGFALAADADETHVEIRRDVQQLRGDLNGVKDSVDALTRGIDEAERARAEERRQQRIADVRRQIFAADRDACQQTPGPLRVQYQNQAAELRSEYRTLTGSEYPGTDCSAFR